MEVFHWFDYIVVIIIIITSLSIGFYFGAIKGFTSTEEFLMGNREMNMFPVIMSLVASYVSGISILGISTDTYLYGIHYVYTLLGLIMAAGTMNYIYLPVLYKLKLTSCYEYFEKRFDKKVRIFGSFLFGIHSVSWLGIVTYVATLTLNQVTGLHIHLIAPVICIVCLIYTSMGGFKAVVFTDVVQCIIMFVSLVLMAIKGTFDVGGFQTVLERNLESERVEGPSFSLNPSVTYTFWSVTVGASTYYLFTSCIDQTMLQRYLSLPVLSAAKKSVWFFVMGYSIFVILCCYCGLLLYATFYKCDPLETGLAKKKDQLIPLLAMKVLNNYPGLPGFFVAGILSASLSSLSTGFHSLAAVIATDLQMYFTGLRSQKRSALVIKAIIVISGGICISLVYVIEHLGAILQVYMSIGAVSNGATLGLFTAGVLFPCINANGALVGGILSLGFMTWLCVKTQIDIASGELTFPQKPLSTERCTYDFVFNQSKIIIQNRTTMVDDFKGTFQLHHISYLWYTLIGTSIVIISSLLVSLVFKDSNKVNPNLLSPILEKFRIKSKKTYNLSSNDIAITQASVQELF